MHLKDWLVDFLHLFFPPRCIVCGRSLTPSEQHMCIYCRADFPYYGVVSIPRKWRDLVLVEHLFALFEYEHGTPYRRLVHMLKYHRRREVGIFLGHLLAEEYLQVLEQPPGRLYLEWDREVTFYERSRASLYFASYLLSIPYLQLVERDFRASLATALSNARELLHAPGVALVWMESPSSLLAAGSVALYWGTEHGGQWREEGELSSSELKLLERFKDPSSPYSQTLAHRARAEQIAELNSLWDCEYSAWIEVALDLAPQTRCWLALAMQAPGAEVDDFYLKAWADLAQIMHFICLYHLSFVRWQRGVKDFKRVHSSEDKLMSQADHAIRQPLNVVISAAEILSDRQFYDNLSAEERREWVSNIHNYGQVLLQLVNDILDYSKLKAGHMKFTPYPLPLPAFMESIVAPYRKEALAKGLEFRLNLETQATILLNGQRLGQVLDNLLSNAVKFTDEGGVSVTLKKEGDHAVVTVSDTGCGISAETGRHIFEDFYQGDTSHAADSGMKENRCDSAPSMVQPCPACRIRPSNASSTSSTGPSQEARRPSTPSRWSGWPKKRKRQM